MREAEAERVCEAYWSSVTVPVIAGNGLGGWSASQATHLLDGLKESGELGIGRGGGTQESGHEIRNRRYMYVGIHFVLICFEL